MSPDTGSAANAAPDLERIVAETTEAIELDHGYRDPYLHRGLACLEIGELDPYAWSGYRHRGIVLHMMGGGDASYRDYLWARELQEEAWRRTKGRNRAEPTTTLPWPDSDALW